jgi:hypothetical protein
LRKGERVSSLAPVVETENGTDAAADAEDEPVPEAAVADVEADLEEEEES